MDILGAPYLTGYEPILENGKVIGAWYVGFKADLAGLKTLIGQASAFGSGFVVLLDGRAGRFAFAIRQRRAHSDAAATSASGRGRMARHRAAVSGLGFAVAVAYSEDEVAAAGRRAALPVLLSGWASPSPCWRC